MLRMVYPHPDESAQDEVDVPRPIKQRGWQLA